jgi:hypothetical protein
LRPIFSNVANFLQEYSEDSNSEPDVDLENQYYNSKSLKEDDPKAALASFQKVLDLEGHEKGEWGFKALKQMIKINFKLVPRIYIFVLIIFVLTSITFTEQLQGNDGPLQTTADLHKECRH